MEQKKRGPVRTREPWKKYSLASFAPDFQKTEGEGAIFFKP